MLIFTFSYNLLLAVIYALNTYCVGYVAAAPFVKQVSSPWLRLILRSALGWCILVFLIHFFGIISFLNVYVYTALTLFGIIVSVIIYRQAFTLPLARATELIRNVWHRLVLLFRENKLIVVCLLVFIVLLFIVALAPVSKTDELNYYFHFVKRIVVNHGIVFDYYPTIAFQPMAQSLWYVPVFGLGAKEAPAMLNVFASFLLLFIAYGWLKKYLSSKWAVLAAVAIYINLNAISVYPAPQDNVVTWVWGLTALILTFEFLYSDNARVNLKTNLLILGVIYSAAYLSKLTNLPLIFFCFLATMVALIKNKWGWRKIIYVFIPPAVFVAPFLIRIYVWTGNPLFPAMLNLFGSTTFDVTAVKVYIANLGRVWPHDIVGLLKALFDELVYNLKWNASPLLILLSPIGWFYLCKNKKILSGLIAMAFIVVMTLAAGSHRLSVGVLMFSVLALFIFGQRFVQNKYIVGLFKLHVVLLVIMTVIYSFQFGRYVFGFENKQEFFRSKVQAYEEIQWANKNLPAESVILTGTWEQYYFDFPTYCLNEYPLVIGADARAWQSAEQIYTFLKSKKISHLFLTKGHDGFSQNLEAELFQVGETYGRLIYEHDQATVRGFRYPTKKPILGRVAIYQLN